MAQLIAYPALVTFNREKNVYQVEFPDLPKIQVFGSNLNQAKANAALEMGRRLFSANKWPIATSMTELVNQYPEKIITRIEIDFDLFSHLVTRFRSKALLC